MSRNAAQARRNLAVGSASVAAVGALFLYPTSTNSSSAPRRPGQALATPGVVTPSAPTADTVVTGTSVDTRYGPVQVRLRVRARRVVRATAIDYPQGSGRDREINSFAIPELEKETLQAQSARVDTVSGATYTSDGYRASLQAALDLAHLG